MLTKKVKKRVSFLTIFLALTVLGVFSILKTLDRNLLYFKSPSDVKADQDISYTKKLRIGGMVKKDSLKIDSEDIEFVITDYKNEIFVSFKGTVPNLFSEGKGVVAEGILNDKGFFIADRILAKHDENYMPPELKDIIKDVK